MPIPEPPFRLPPGRVVHVRGRGEFFIRDSGGSGPPLLLLHGWMFAADLNWLHAYRPLAERGFRVLAMDLRGHGRGLRTAEPFTLEACAADAAAVVGEIGAAPVVAVGYSMGGPVAQLMARDHPDTVAGLVMCATTADWQDVYLKLFWRTMSVLRLLLGLFPTRVWEWMLRGGDVGAGPDERAWVAAELSRGSSVDLAEAGRAMSRYDGRGWLGSLRGIPAAVVLTTRDRQVLPRKQRRLAKLLDAAVFEVRADHMAAASHPREFVAALLGALDAVLVAGARSGADREQLASAG